MSFAHRIPGTTDQSISFKVVAPTPTTQYFKSAAPLNVRKWGSTSQLSPQPPNDHYPKPELDTNTKTGQQAQCSQQIKYVRNWRTNRVCTQSSEPVSSLGYINPRQRYFALSPSTAQTSSNNKNIVNNTITDFKSRNPEKNLNYGELHFRSVNLDSGIKTPNSQEISGISPGEVGAQTEIQKWNALQQNKKNTTLNISGYFSSAFSNKENISTKTNLNEQIRQSEFNLLREQNTTLPQKSSLNNSYLKYEIKQSTPQQKSISTLDQCRDQMQRLRSQLKRRQQLNKQSNDKERQQKYITDLERAQWIRRQQEMGRDIRSKDDLIKQLKQQLFSLRITINNSVIQAKRKQLSQLNNQISAYKIKCKSQQIQRDNLKGQNSILLNQFQLLKQRYDKTQKQFQTQRCDLNRKIQLIEKQKFLLYENFNAKMANSSKQLDSISRQKSQADKQIQNYNQTIKNMKLLNQTWSVVESQYRKDMDSLKELLASEKNRTEELEFNLNQCKLQNNQLAQKINHLVEESSNNTNLPDKRIIDQLNQKHHNQNMIIRNLQKSLSTLTTKYRTQEKLLQQSNEMCIRIGLRNIDTQWRQ